MFVHGQTRFVYYQQCYVQSSSAFGCHSQPFRNDYTYYLLVCAEQIVLECYTMFHLIVIEHNNPFC